MSLTETAQLTLEELYCRQTPGSAQRALAARRVLPSGIAHDSRRMTPHPLYIKEAKGSRKWDVDGNEYVDYAGGHGALLLGHQHPAITEAVAKQLERGTHFGSCHEQEFQWAELVQQLIPSAEKVRFTSSGTEATLLAVRLARAWTGRAKLIRFLGHFHGWHDHMAFGVASHLDGSPTPGVLQEVASNVLLCPAGDTQALKRLLSEHDVAGVIVEPTGGSWGHVPLAPAFLHDLRRLTAEHQAVLIFDEVITGFRCSPGGAQQVFGVTPDLTTLAKILAGGLPGGAICGKAEIMEALAFAPQAGAPQAGASQGVTAGREKVPHQGTFNANPLSAAAGVATLQLVQQTDACQRANDYAARLRAALNQVFVEESVSWCVYGTFSGFHFYTGESRTPEELERGDVPLEVIHAAADRNLHNTLRQGFNLGGVDIFSWPGGPTSAVHTEDDLDRTVTALRQAVRKIFQRV